MARIVLTPPDMMGDMDPGSTPVYRDVDTEEATARVPAYALSLARDLARLVAAPEPSLHTVPRSGLHAVVPPPRRQIALPSAARDEDDDEPTSKQPHVLRLITDDTDEDDEDDEWTLRMLPFPSADHPIAERLDEDDDDPGTLRMQSAPNMPVALPVSGVVALETIFERRPDREEVAALSSPSATRAIDEEPNEVPAGLEPRRRPRTSVFYWAASVASVIGGCALTSVLIHVPLPVRAAHVVEPMRVAACVGDGARPRTPAVDVASSAGKSAPRATAHRSRPRATGIVRESPY
jgi:hypothetical protein